MCPNCFRTLQRETQQNKVKKFQRTTLALYIESLYRVSIPPLRGGGGGLLLHRQNWSPFSPVLTLPMAKARYRSDHISIEGFRGFTSAQVIPCDEKTLF